MTTLTGPIRFKPKVFAMTEAMIWQQPFAVNGRGSGVTRLVFNTPGPAVTAVGLGNTNLSAHRSTIAGVTIENRHPEGWALATVGARNLDASDIQLISGTYDQGGRGCLRIARGEAGTAYLTFRGLVCLYGENVITLHDTNPARPWTNGMRVVGIVHGDRDTRRALWLIDSASNIIDLGIEKAQTAVDVDGRSRYNQIRVVVEAGQSPVNVRVAPGANRNRIVGHFDEERVTDQGAGNVIEGTRRDE